MASDPGEVKGLVLKGNELSWYPVPDMRYVVYAVPVVVSPLDAIAFTGANFMSAYILGICYGNNFQLPADKLRGYLLPLFLISDVTFSLNPLAAISCSKVTCMR